MQKTLTEARDVNEQVDAVKGEINFLFSVSFSLLSYQIISYHHTVCVFLLLSTLFGGHKCYTQASLFLLRYRTNLSHTITAKVRSLNDQSKVINKSISKQIIGYRNTINDAVSMMPEMDDSD